MQDILQRDRPYHEPDLLRQLATGSEDAFRTLFNAYRDKLYSYVVKLSGSTIAAEDTVHEVFLKLWVKRAELSEIKDVNAYLYRMARNKAINLFKRMAQETLILSEIGKDQGQEAGFAGEDKITHAEVLAAIREAVNKLTPQQREVFTLSRQKGMTISEIADHLNIAERTVKNHISLALRFLRAELGREFGTNAVIIYAIYHLASI